MTTRITSQSGYRYIIVHYSRHSSSVVGRCIAVCRHAFTVAVLLARDSLPVPVSVRTDCDVESL